MNVATRHRFSVDEYVALQATHVLGVVPRTELLSGEIFEMTPISDLHASTVDRMAEILAAAARREGPIVRVQSHIVLDEWSMPQPDIALLRRRDDFYKDRSPGPKDVVLVIEVAVSSLAHDRDAKLPLYAAAGIPEVWIVVPRGGEIDATSAGIYLYGEPAGGVYARRSFAGLNDDVRAPGLDGPLLVDEVVGS